MRALLNINLLIALFDSNHSFHERAHDWWAANLKRGWASCPLTENGIVRIMSNLGYSQQTRLTPGELIGRLKEFVSATDHQFWPDDVSLREPKNFAIEQIHSSRQLTDLYLLALASKNGGRLATFDENITLSAVLKAKTENLCIV